MLPFVVRYGEIDNAAVTAAGQRVAARRVTEYWLATGIGIAGICGSRPNNCRTCLFIFDTNNTLIARPARLRIE